jgi:tetratricopeptide (TPR) repeat protein
MRKEGIAPNVITYNTLIDKADFANGKQLLETMRKEGIAPNVITYNSLFKGDIGESADELLRWYLAQVNHPDSAIDVAIASYQRVGSIQNAMRLALDYPHLSTARKLMREQTDCLSYFKSFLATNSRHPNADYALGRFYIEQGKLNEARPHLEKALKLATAESRKKVVRDWLREVQASK